MAPSGSARETAGTTICLIVRYVRHHAGDEGVERLLTLAGDDRPIAVLENEQHWSTYDQKIALLEAAAIVLDDPDVALHIGETALDHSVGPGIRILLRRLGSPRMVLANVSKAAAKFSTVRGGIPNSTPIVRMNPMLSWQSARCARSASWSR